MNSKHKIAGGLALAFAAAVSHAEVSNPECAPKMIELRTEFPASAQEQGRSGRIELAIQLDARGRVSAAEVSQSSGHTTLDAAAISSALKSWRFDIGHCTVAELNRQRVVAVSYRRAPGITVSGTLNRKALAVERSLSNNSECQASRTDSETKVFACKISEQPQRVADRPPGFTKGFAK